MYYISVSTREATGASALVQCMAFIPTCIQVLYRTCVLSFAITFDTFQHRQKNTLMINSGDAESMKMAKIS